MSSSHPRPRYDVNSLRAKVHEALRSHGKVTGPPAQCDNLTQATALLLMHGISVKDIATILDRTPAYVRVMRRKLVLRAGLETAREPKEKKPRETAVEDTLDAGLLRGGDLPIEQLAPLCEKLRATFDAGMVQEYDVATLRNLGRDDLAARRAEKDALP